jgi:hypothetical protein
MWHFLRTKWHCGMCPPKASGSHACSRSTYCYTTFHHPGLVPLVAGVKQPQSPFELEETTACGTKFIRRFMETRKLL